jgi:hypothetical protein
VIATLNRPIDPLLLLSIAADLVGDNPDFNDGIAALVAAVLGEPDADRAEVLAVLARIAEDD